MQERVLGITIMSGFVCVCSVGQGKELSLTVMSSLVGAPFLAARRESSRCCLV